MGTTYPAGYTQPTVVQGTGNTPGSSANNNINAASSKHTELLKHAGGNSGVKAPDVPSSGSSPGGPGQNHQDIINKATQSSMQGAANRQYDTVGGTRRRRRRRTMSRKKTKRRKLKQKRTKKGVKRKKSHN